MMGMYLIPALTSHILICTYLFVSRINHEITGKNLQGRWGMIKRGVLTNIFIRSDTKIGVQS